MNENQTAKEEVYRILKNNEATRNSDMKLYLEYCKYNLVRESEMYRVFDDPAYRKAKHISPFETISRARRDLQSQFIELNATEEVEKERMERESMFENYYGRSK